MNPVSILVVNVSRIGDTLLATPAIKALATAWPAAHIDVLGHPGRVEVLEYLPFVRSVGAITKRSAPLRGWADRFARTYDLALVYGFDKGLLSYAFRVAKHVVAYRQQDPHLNERLWKVVEHPPFQSDHSVRLALSLTDAIGVAPAGLRLSYAVTQDERKWAADRFASDVPECSRPVIGLQIASFPTKAYRDWPIPSFIELCGRICRDWPQSHFLIFGGNDEQAQVNKLAASLGSRATVYAGRLSLRQTGALMDRLDLYIGVDTGPTHLMSCFNIPLVGLYHGFSRSELIAPLEHPCLYAIDHPLAGPGCSVEASMADITVDRVWDAVQKALFEHPPQ